MVPWLLPPLEDFTRGANVEVMDDVTLAFVPRDVAKVGREGVADDQDESRKYPRLELKFATDGRLTDRRWLEMPGRTLLIREHYAADGTVHLFDAGDREIAARKLTIEPASAPNLVPNMSDLVVLTMPLRSREQVFQSAGRPQDGQFGQWSEEDALALLAADILQNPSEAMQIVGQRFFAKGDRRLGLYTLLLSSGVTWNPATDIALNNQSHVRFDPAADHPDSVLARYIYLHAQQMATAGTIGEMDLARSDSGLVQRLAGFRDLYVLWTSGKAASEPDRTKLRGRALQFVRESNGSFFGWVVLSLLQNSTQDANGFRELSDAYRVFERSRGLSYAARYEAAYSAYQTGDAQRAMDLFRELHERTLKEGFVPPVDTRFRQSFQNTPHGQTALAKLWRDSAEMLIARGGHVAALALAWQCNQLGDAVAAQEVFATVMRGASGEYRWQISLAAVDYLIQVGEYARADALLQPMLDDETLGKFASLWRLGAMVAEKQGMTASAIARLDRAMDIEYSQLPNEVDLESARTEFRKLLDGYQKLADSLVSLPSQPPQDILHRIARAADRWRSLDPDDTAACQAAARVFDRLGARERAWEYLTTPFGEKPNELPAWLGLGQWLRAQGCIELADRAYQLAFAAEPGNAQIIWELAQMLEQSGKPAAAQQWYRAIAEGQWGSQFESIQSQARQAIR
jgi:tetratricopeptide (TPR) repeat protein